ncbi:MULTISPECIES: cytochrome b [Halomonadaceae]|uniref:Cytochrome b n=1 Tax=Billgrantia aerodenitrificans TaxID=2733483 RepID=A0ABS9AYI0_9GAMM|nr:MULTISPECIES: cytochrome b/b6 domain-containing protein [Halomonas]MCE8026869.1 cytochrome b [Halomonas aerodenitrificans]MCE8039383.1 cytochrome b [Halomonas sp. MCCC 1A11062]
MSPAGNAHYGRVNRYLHWGMALLLAWQFTTTSVRVLLSDSALDELLWPTHRSTGFLLMVLVVVRVLWALASRASQPPAVSRAARLGHLALYGLMLVVPTLALLRQYGSGRAFEPFGIPLMSGFEGERIEWMVAAGSLLHGELGWLLLALIVGHVAMVFWHRRHGQDVLGRMLVR